MAEVRVKRLGACRAEKDRAEYQEPAGIVDKESHRIPGVERFHYRPVVGEMQGAEDAEHQKPREHEWAEKPADGLCAEPLDEKNS